MTKLTSGERATLRNEGYSVNDIREITRTIKTTTYNEVLPSGETRMVLVSCRATVGTVSNTDHNLESHGKAGRRRPPSHVPSFRFLHVYASLRTGNR